MELKDLLVTDQLWQFAGLVLLTFMASVNGRIGQLGTLPMILFKLPCTILHELAHLVVGLLTGAHPSGLSLIPRREDAGERTTWRLGSVSLQSPAPLSCLPTALAPLLYIPLAYINYRLWPVWFPITPGYVFGMYLAIAIMLGSSVPSGADVKIAFSNLRGNLFYLLLTLSVLLYIIFQSQ